MIRTPAVVMAAQLHFLASKTQILVVSKMLIINEIIRMSHSCRACGWNGFRGYGNNWNSFLHESVIWGVFIYTGTNFFEFLAGLRDEFLSHCVIWDVIFSQGAILWLTSGTGRPLLA